jgi:hypothetical protein
VRTKALVLLPLLPLAYPLGFVYGLWQRRVDLLNHTWVGDVVGLLVTLAFFGGLFFVLVWIFLVVIT